MACDNKRIGCDDSVSKGKPNMKMRIMAVCCLCNFCLGCSQPSPVLTPVTALAGNVDLSIPTGWSNHQILHGWASDCNGCSYSEPSDYFGEDSLVQMPITPPKRSFCIVGSKIQPGSFQRSFPFKPDVKEEAHALIGLTHSFRQVLG